MEIKFTKMHGIGNDYIYVNCMEHELPDPNNVAIAMSRRHFSVGSDGLVLICPSTVADVRMRMFNADGSEGRMCGNAIRCIGKYVYEKKIVNKTHVSVETLSGIKQLDLTVVDGFVTMIKADLGIADFTPANVPVLSDVPFINMPVEALGRTYKSSCVSVGSPHVVTYVDDPATFDLERIGPAFENNKLFPDRINSEFIKVLDRHTIQMRVWERGSGETWACGTGASASAAVSAKLGLCDFNTPITVKLLGGDLQITCTEDYHIYMSGPAEIAFEGTYEYKGQEIK